MMSPRASETAMPAMAPVLMPPPPPEDAGMTVPGGGGGALRVGSLGISVEGRPACCMSSGVCTKVMCLKTACTFCAAEVCLHTR